MGSIHFYGHQQDGPVHCAIVLDLMGHDVEERVVQAATLAAVMLFRDNPAIFGKVGGTE